MVIPRCSSRPSCQAQALAQTQPMQPTQPTFQAQKRECNVCNEFCLIFHIQVCIPYHTTQNYSLKATKYFCC